MPVSPSSSRPAWSGVFDPAVSLAYCQSVMIGPEGERLPGDYISLTNDLSMTHWRQPYCVPAVEEVELALSQRNTIPNASAVLFRKRADLDCRAELERMRLAGDWLFYAMQIRDGRISYVPDPLNFHRHHNRTVRHAFECAAEPSRSSCWSRRESSSPSRSRRTRSRVA